MTPEMIQAWAAILAALAWPLIVCIFAVLFWRRLIRFFDAITGRVSAGEEIQTIWFTLGKSGALKIPAPDGVVTDEHLALIHSSWRRSDKDAEFGGAEMYQIHVIVYSKQEEVLDRIQYVIYYLDPAYPQPVQSSTVRARNFELKELANGYSVVQADVKIKGQAETVRLSRFINLTEEGPRLDVYMKKRKIVENM